VWTKFTLQIKLLYFNMINFSVVLIAKNEAKTLPRLLKSLDEFRQKNGEIILLDTGSTDKTVEVANSYGCIVHEVGDRFVHKIDSAVASQINDLFCINDEQKILLDGDRIFDFSKARNYAATLATNDMIAMPDCDEIYTKLDLDKITKVIDQGAEQLEYNFVFSHDQFGNELVKFMHSKFYNRKKLSWVRIIHEILSGDAHRLYLDETVIKLEHFQNHETNRSGYIKGLALDCFYDHVSDRNSHYFGRELFWSGRYKSAIKELTRHTNIPTSNNFKAEQAQSVIFIGDCYEKLGEYDNAIDAWSRAFLIDSSRRESLLRLAQFFYKRNDAQKTACYCGAALQIQNGFFYANNQYDYSNHPHELMYWAQWNTGDHEASKYHFDKAHSYQPLNSKYLHDYRFYYDLPKISIVLPTLGRQESLQRCLSSIKHLNYPQEKIELIVIEDEPRVGVPKRVAEGVDKSTGEFIVFASNDIEFSPDSLILAFIEMTHKNKALASFNTGDLGEDLGNICEHFIIRKNFLPLIDNEIFDTEFYHVGVDNLLWAKCSKLKQSIRCEHAYVKHYHFSRGEKFDDVYKLGWDEDNVKHDRKLLVKKLSELSEIS